VLGVAGPAELLVHLARESLERREGVVRGDDGRYRLAAAAAPRHVAVFLRTTGGHPPYDLLLDAGVAEVRDGEATGAWGSFVRPDRPLSPAAVEAAGVPPRDLEAGRPIDEVLDRIAPLADGARILCFDSDRPAAASSAIAAGRRRRARSSCSPPPSDGRSGCPGAGRSGRPRGRSACRCRRRERRRSWRSRPPGSSSRRPRPGSTSLRGRRAPVSTTGRWASARSFSTTSPSVPASTASSTAPAGSSTSASRRTCARA